MTGTLLFAPFVLVRFLRRLCAYPTREHPRGQHPADFIAYPSSADATSGAIALLASFVTPLVTPPWKRAVGFPKRLKRIGKHRCRNKGEFTVYKRVGSISRESLRRATTARNYYSASARDRRTFVRTLTGAFDRARLIKKFITSIS